MSDLLRVKNVTKVTKMAKARKVSSTSSSMAVIPGNGLPVFSSVKSSVVVPSKSMPSRRTEEIAHVPVPAITTLPAQCSIAVSPSRSDEHSLSVDETMSTCESFKSPDVEYVDNNEVSALDSVDRKTFSNLCISEHAAKTGEYISRSLIISS